MVHELCLSPLKDTARRFRGIEASAGEYIIMADADDSYDLEDLMPF